MRLAALTSGGKDSSYAIYLAMQQGHEITSLVTIKPQRFDSYMYHTANIHMVDYFAEACGIPLIAEPSSGEKEEELEDLERALQRAKAIGIDGVIVGAIESEYQASRVKRICDSLSLEMYAPLWYRNPKEILQEIIKTLEVIFVQVSAEGLDERWLGRRLDREAIQDLKALHKKYRIHLAGEGGEYETLVLDAPFFKKRIKLKETRPVWKRDWGILEILKAELLDK